MRMSTLVHGFLCSTLMPRLSIGGTVDPVDPVETWFMQPPGIRLAISDPWLAGVRLTAWTVRQVGVKGPRVENKGFKLLSGVYGKESRILGLAVSAFGVRWHWMGAGGGRPWENGCSHSYRGQGLRARA